MNTARNLERIADHAAKIAESVIYLKKGEILRHRPADSAREASLASLPRPLAVRVDRDQPGSVQRASSLLS